jgi:hypothetical protein
VTVRFAWPAYATPWELALSGLSVDGVTGHDLFDAPHRRLVLAGLDNWQSATFTVTATTGEQAPAGAVDLQGFVTVTSTGSNSRVPFLLAKVGTGAQGFSGQVEIERAVFAGVAELSFDVGARIGPRARRIGTTEPWKIVLDPADAPMPPGRPPFDTVWVDFGAAASPPVARQDPTAYAVMDLSDGKPRLLMNGAIEGLWELIRATAPRQEKRRLRAIIGTLIARDATATLVRAAAAEVIPPYIDDTFVVQPPQTPLYIQVCEAVAAEMASVASATEFYDRLSDAARDEPAKRAQFWAEIDAAVERLTNHAEVVGDAVREIKYA